MCVCVCVCVCVLVNMELAFCCVLLLFHGRYCSFMCSGLCDDKSNTVHYVDPIPTATISVQQLHFCTMHPQTMTSLQETTTCTHTLTHTRTQARTHTHTHTHTLTHTHTHSHTRTKYRKVKALAFGQTWR